MIHRVSDDGGGLAYPFPLVQFTALVDWMHNNGYKTITISEWYILNTEATASMCFSLSSSNDVVSKFIRFDITRIAAGFAGIVYHLMSFGFAGRNRGYGSKVTINDRVFICSILSIIIGIVVLCMGYEIISADFTTAFACIKWRTGYVQQHLATSKVS